MSSTYKKLLVLAAFVAAPINALAFDFDKEIAKQNTVTIEINNKKEQRSLEKDNAGDKTLKVALIARKR
ncbi:MAG: hypothetical protein H6625_09275 [Bdellovibrionaceae bacterium]|nr:hypothetical protein [Pseudobdellovibrionaceae bacterium]